MNIFKQQRFQRLQEINKQIYETLENEKNVEYSQICFNLLFTEFTKEIEELENNGVHSSEIKDFLSLYAPKNISILATLNKFYGRFLKTNKKQTSQPN